MGSLARAGSEARPGSERRRPAAGRRPVPSTGQNTVLPAHSGLRPPFTTEERIRSGGAAAARGLRGLSPSWPGTRRTGTPAKPAHRHAGKGPILRRLIARCAARSRGLNSQLIGPPRRPIADSEAARGALAVRRAPAEY